MLDKRIESYQYKTELHLHTSPASGCSEVAPEVAVKLYADLGYHSVVVCNHFFSGMHFYGDKETCLKEYFADYERAVEAGEKYGVNVILGCEIRFTENENDYLLFGIDKNFIREAYDCLDMGIEAFSKHFRREDRLLVQAHPFRNGMTSVSLELLDGIEAFNMHPNHNSRVALAAKYAREHGLIPTVGSDFHHIGHEGISALLTKTEIKTSNDIVDVLNSGDYLFEIGGSILLV